LIKRYLLLCLCALSLSLIASAQAEPVKDFAVVDTAGKTHTLSQYRGKWVVVNYWATWCGPCLEEVPDLIAFYEGHRGRDVMVLGVALEYPNVKEVKDYVSDMLMSYPVILGDDQATGQVQHPDVLPTTYIYNPKGELVKVKRGIVSKHYLDKLVRQKG
jgi:thiol-disulfide isomerase/thioredoxin